jgi:uncharacterized protein YbjT (DUF2867 family)
MILITDGCSSLGQAVVRALYGSGRQVRCLLQPSRCVLRLPTGIPLSTVSASLNDLPALRSSLQGVTAVIHLLSEWDIPPHKSALDHPRDTASLVEAMRDVGVERLIYISRLGADPASGYPVFRLRGQAESAVRESGLAFTILQPAITYGRDDGFISLLATLAAGVPFVLPLPDVGLSRYQPLWVEDLGRAVLVTLEREGMIGQVIRFGGPEYFTLEQLAVEVLRALGLRRRIVRLRLPLVQLALSVLDSSPLHNPCPLWLLDIL